LNANRGGIFSKAKVPTLLHVCHESRVIGLKFYKLSFADYLGLPGRTYFDPNIDGILLLRDYGFHCTCTTAHGTSTLIDTAERNSIQRALWEGHTCALETFRADYPGLKDLIVLENIGRQVEMNLADMLVDRISVLKEVKYGIQIEKWATNTKK